MPDDDYAINRVEWLEPIWAKVKARIWGRRSAPDEDAAPEQAAPAPRVTGVGGHEWGDRGIYKDPYRG